MQNKKTSFILWIIFGILIIIAAIVLLEYKNRVVVPTVGADGKISGNYSIAGIMKLGKPYECAFQKSDGTSNITGTIFTDGSGIYGEFGIKTDLVKNRFNDFLLIKNGQAYIWTSLGNLGYRSPAAKSANKNASPREQAQIVGTEDVMQYDCQPWNQIDNSVFEIPSSIKFYELK